MNAYVLVVVTLSAIFALCTSTSYSHCIDKCLSTTKLTSHHCHLSCEFKDSLGPLEVMIDGQRIVPDKESVLSDQNYHAASMRFDRPFYTTPQAFSEVLNFKGELMSKFHQLAQSRFVTPGARYAPGTKLHVLPVPIPLTQEQANNQEFMNSLLDVVPSENLEYTPVSTLSLSEAYKGFLLNVKVDNAENPPRSQAARDHITNTETTLNRIMDEYMVAGTKCFEAYELHIATQQLSPISYTMEQFSSQNQHCKQANAKLADHTRISNELAQYVTDLNPYNRLFESIGKMKAGLFNWDYSREDIRAFTAYHVDLESKNIVPTSSKFEIPVDITRNFFSHYYFGSTTQYSEKNINAHLMFSGLGWKESPISPSKSWFDLSTLHKYKSSPQVKPKNFFGQNGMLNRIPSHILVAYKPQLRVKISRTMKEEFNSRVRSVQLRPIETGSMVFTNVEVKEVQGGKVNEEYEMIFTSSIRDAQILGFKSTPIVNLPTPPVPPPPEYTRFINKRVAIRSVSHGTYFRSHESSTKVDAQTYVDNWEKWFVRDVGDGKIALLSYHGRWLREQPNGIVETHNFLGGWEHFTMIKSGDHWVFKTFHNRYLRIQPGREGAKVDSNAFIGAWEKFTIEILPDPVYTPYLDKLVTLKTKFNSYIRAQPGGEGSVVDTNSFVGGWEKFRLVYAGGDYVSFLSSHGTYMRALPFKPVDVQTFLDKCEKFSIKRISGNKFSLTGACVNVPMRVLSAGDRQRPITLFPFFGRGFHYNTSNMPGTEEITIDILQ